MFNSRKIKIISGGQTGVDRAALDFAIENDIPCGGWCPKGRIAEDGKIPFSYPMLETNSSDYQERTRKNIIESDGTLFFFLRKFDQGTNFAIESCKELNIPFLIINPTMDNYEEKITRWISEHRISILNIAGPRESNEPGVYEFSNNILNSLVY